MRDCLASKNVRQWKDYRFVQSSSRIANVSAHKQNYDQYCHTGG